MKYIICLIVLISSNVKADSNQMAMKLDRAGVTPEFALNDLGAPQETGKIWDMEFFVYKGEISGQPELKRLVLFFKEGRLVHTGQEVKAQPSPSQAPSS